MLSRALRWLGIAALAIGYPLLAHYTNRHPPADAPNHLGLVVALTPIVLLLTIFAWRSTRRALMLSVLGVFFAALYAAWPRLARHYGLVYWIEHVGTQFMLCILFGRTLADGRLPLCTLFARIVHAPAKLLPEQEHYARHITRAWAIFFALNATVSTLLFFGTPIATWSTYANFVTPVLVVGLFVVEYRVRLWLLPHIPHARLMDAARAFKNFDPQHPPHMG